ncbi:hypothetical protein VAE130_570514 [Vibrio aestuarianus]|uniref:Uncharacterized protein n=1 Tax=Vibrio aestuarianus TaxID=28171 RepID=A0ABM9FRA1_9VIBR|nr:hypothetical protein VIBAE_A31107 [Vibrio aestuarianus subsp. francensis]CAH8197583.1 hypothetical protein VAE055_370510 [Vibrio aestuarianus]CAH8197795.1 hypothetical protein VAE128_460514 [Vibrio aestuarianus]CAH8198023.1 hypothetical protein VAE130_570514 [Vibrio aestuarianus]CAH8229237.1 hypothetical protein VAE063_940516 [Vibrio aestuarianus]
MIYGTFSPINVLKDINPYEEDYEQPYVYSLSKFREHITNE